MANTVCTVVTPAHLNMKEQFITALLGPGIQCMIMSGTVLMECDLIPVRIWQGPYVQLAWCAQQRIFKHVISTWNLDQAN